MVIDVAKCNGCYSCVLACKDEHCGETFPGYTEAQPMTGQFWFNLVEKERGTLGRYLHRHYIHALQKPLCIRLQEYSVYRRMTASSSSKKAVGQKQIVSACPYGSFLNEERIFPKCTVRLFVGSGYERPRCAEMCPTTLPKNLEDRRHGEKTPMPFIGNTAQGKGFSECLEIRCGTVVYSDTDEAQKVST
jgi:Fe-S-cluster-containing dehydrogenase component